MSIREMWLPRTTVRPRPSRSRPLGTCSSRNSSRSTNVRTARLPPPPTCPPSRMSAETPAMRRPQTPRSACQFGRLASTSSVGTWTPCAASSAAVDALGSDPSSAEHARPSLPGRVRRRAWRTHRLPPQTPWIVSSPSCASGPAWTGDRRRPRGWQVGEDGGHIHRRERPPPPFDPNDPGGPSLTWPCCCATLPCCVFTAGGVGESSGVLEQQGRDRAKRAWPFRVFALSLLKIRVGVL